MRLQQELRLLGGVLAHVEDDLAAEGRVSRPTLTQLRERLICLGRALVAVLLDLYQRRGSGEYPRQPA